jgi:hypothetical protein
MLGVQFCGFAGVMRCVLRVTLRRVRVMRGSFVVSSFVLLAGFTMMSSRVLMMLCSLAMVIRCFLCHCNLLVQRGCGHLGPCFNLASTLTGNFARIYRVLARGKLRTLVITC